MIFLVMKNLGSRTTIERRKKEHRENIHLQVNYHFMNGGMINHETSRRSSIHLFQFGSLTG